MFSTAVMYASGIPQCNPLTQTEVWTVGTERNVEKADTE